MTKKGFLDGYKKYDTSKGFGDFKKWKEAFCQRMDKEEAKELIGRISETPYDILEIPTTSLINQIKRAFKLKILEWHPDRNPHRLHESEEMTKKIIAAYTILTKNR